MNLFKKRHIHLLLVPEDDSKGIKIRFSTKLFWLLVGILCFIVIVYLVSVITYGKVFSVAILSNSLSEENKKLKEENAKVVMLQKELEEYRKFTQKVAELAGVSFPSKEKETSSLINIASAENLSTSNNTKKIKNTPSGAPVAGAWLSKGFEEMPTDSQEIHLGVDLAVKERAFVRATADGIVKFAGLDKELGKLVVLDHQNGFETYYGHNNLIKVKVGQTVRRGDVIALSGSTGKSSAPHLHYEIRKNGKPINPKEFLDN